MDKILILELVSILQSIAICFLGISVIKLRKLLCLFIEDEFSVSRKLHHYLTDPLDIVNAHPKYDDLGINPFEK